MKKSVKWHIWIASEVPRVFVLLFVFIIPFLVYAGISNPELLSVTENSFALYWDTDKAELCAINYGATRSNMDKSWAESGKPKKFHFLEVKGLKPGKEYYYQIKCGQEKSRQTRMSPGRFTTLTLPAGKQLFSFAVLTDMHIKEDVAGLILLPGAKNASLIPGFKWKDPDDPYWNFTNRNAIERINQLKPDFTIVNGDLTSWFTEDEFLIAKQMLDKLQMPYYVLRGNHDRVEDQPEDWFKKVFGLKQSYYSFEQGGFLFICLDSVRLKDGWEDISQEQWQWLESTLRGNALEPTFIFTHYQIGIGAPGINKDDQKRFLSILEQNPQTIACFYGHQHGARVEMLKFGERTVPQIIVPTAKEYPSGFALVRVFETGFVYNFQSTDCENCLEWRSITRGEYFGLAPEINGGSLSERNFVYHFPLEIQALVKK